VTGRDLAWENPATVVPEYSPPKMLGKPVYLGSHCGTESRCQCDKKLHNSLMCTAFSTTSNTATTFNFLFNRSTFLQLFQAGPVPAMP